MRGNSGLGGVRVATRIVVLHRRDRVTQDGGVPYQGLVQDADDFGALCSGELVGRLPLPYDGRAGDGKGDRGQAGDAPQEAFGRRHTCNRRAEQQYRRDQSAGGAPQRRLDTGLPDIGCQDFGLNAIALKGIGHLGSLLLERAAVAGAGEAVYGTSRHKNHTDQPASQADRPG